MQVDDIKLRGGKFDYNDGGSQKGIAQERTLEKRSAGKQNREAWCAAQREIKRGREKERDEERQKWKNGEKGRKETEKERYTGRKKTKK
jgi:hypothetical protein